MSATGITKSFDTDELDLRKFKKKWKNTGQYQMYREVRERFSDMELSKSTTCPYDNPDADDDNSGSGGTSWSDRWDRDMKAWSMYKRYLSEGRSNLKSPTVYSPVEALMAEFLETEPDVHLKPTQEEDQEKVNVIRACLDYWKSKSGVDLANWTTLKDAAIMGTSQRLVTYQRIEREVDIIQDSEQITKEVHEVMRNGTKKERDKVRKLVQKDKKPLTKKKTIIEYDDVVHIALSNYEVFWDNHARTSRGPAYEAQDVIWRQFVGMEQFLQEFRNSSDPYVDEGMVERVVPAARAFDEYGNVDPFFTPPDNEAFNAENQVELLRYWNKATDKHIIIANDVIIRDGPLPFNHKQLPIIMHKFRTFPHRLYGMGLGTLLEDTQAEIETLKNMRIEQKHFEINKPLLVQKNEFDNISSAYESLEPGMIIPVRGDPSNVAEFGPKSSYDPDYTSTMAMLDGQKTEISGVNSLAYSMPQPKEAVRNNMMAIESTLKLMKSGFKIWGRGYVEAMQQTVKLMQQYYPLSYVEELNDKDMDKEVQQTGRRIRVEGLRFVEKEVEDNAGKPITDEDGEQITLLEKQDIGDAISSFVVKGEYLDLAGDVDVTMDLDTVVPISKGLEMQNAEKFMMVLQQYMANPAMLENPIAKAALRHYAQVNGLPSEFTETLKDESSEDDVERATEQVLMMLQGEEVPAIPGESTAHIAVHSKAIGQVMAKKKELEEEAGELAPMVEQATASANVQAMDELRERLRPIQDELRELDGALDRISRHLEGDMVPKDLAGEHAMQSTGGGQQGPPQGQPPMPPEEPSMGMQGQAPPMISAPSSKASNESPYAGVGI